MAVTSRQRRRRLETIHIFVFDGRQRVPTTFIMIYLKGSLPAEELDKVLNTTGFFLQ